MKRSSLFAVALLMVASSAAAGTGKQLYNTPSALPAGSTVSVAMVQAVGMGAALATTFTVPPNPVQRYAGIWHVNPDGTLDTSMAPDGVTIHPNQTLMAYPNGFDVAFDKLALVGEWEPGIAPVDGWFQTFNAFDPGEDDPVLNAAGFGGYHSVDHDVANSRFVMVKGSAAPAYFTLVVTDETGALDTSFNGTGKLDLNIVGAFAVARVAPDGTIIVALSQWSYFTGTSVFFRRYSSTGTLLASSTQNIGLGAVASMVVDSSGRPLIGSLFWTFGSGSKAAVRRYTTSLQLDSTFGTGGLATFSFLASPGATFCTAYCNGGFLALQESGKIIYGGHRDGNVSLVAARINTNGTLDTTFGSSGAQYVTASGQTSFDGGLIDVDENDGIWLTGRSFQSGQTNMKNLLSLLTPDGALDGSFGSTP